MREALLLMAAWAVCTLAMAWLALAMDAHWHQALGRAHPLPPARRRALRTAGALGLAASLGLCLLADHPSMAALVWVLLLSVSAASVAFTLSWRPHWLRALSGVVGY